MPDSPAPNRRRSRPGSPRPSRTPQSLRRKRLRPTPPGHVLWPRLDSLRDAEFTTRDTYEVCVSSTGVPGVSALPLTSLANRTSQTDWTGTGEKRAAPRSGPFVHQLPNGASACAARGSTPAVSGRGDWKGQCGEARVGTLTVREHDVLPALVQERHRHGRVHLWNPDRGDLLSRRLVDGVELRLVRRLGRCRTCRTAPATTASARAAAASRTVDHQRLGVDHLRLTADRRLRRQRNAGEEWAGRRRRAHDTAVRDPPLLVTRVHIVGSHATHLLRLHDRNAIDVRRRDLTARSDFSRRVTGRRWQGTKLAAVVARRAVTELGTRILLERDRSQTALSTDEEHARFRIVRRAAVDVDAAAGARSVPRAAHTAGAGSVRQHG